jgi:hypothetical protein
MQIEPETKVVQTHFGGQPSLKSRESLRTRTPQAKGMQELVVDRFDDLPEACQAATQRLRPANALTVLMRWSQQSDLPLVVPAVAWSLAGLALDSYLRAVSGQSCTGQPWRWSFAESNQRRGQVLIMRAGRPKAKAANDPDGRDTQQPMKARVAAKAIAPATIRLPSQPAQAASFGIAGESGGPIEDLIEARLGLHAFNQMQAKGRDRLMMLPHESVELRAIRQVCKGGSQILLSRAVKGSFARKLHPLSKHGQRNHLAALQASLRTRSVFLMRLLRLATIIDHHVQCSQEGIHLDHQLAPFQGIWFDQLTVRGGYLAFQLLSISHQAFKKAVPRQGELAARIRGDRIFFRSIHYARPN